MDTNGWKLIDPILLLSYGLTRFPSVPLALLNKRLSQSQLSIFDNVNIL